MIPFVLNCIATDLALHEGIWTDNNHVRIHDDAWLDMPVDGDV
jgi:hypothetical protein